MDQFSVLTLSTILDVLLTIYFAVLWFQYRHEFKGGLIFIAGKIAFTVAYFGSLQTYLQLPAATILISNIFLPAGAILIYLSFTRYFNRSVSRKRAASLIAVFALTIIERTIFGYFYPNTSIRVALSSLLLAYPYLLTAWLLFHYRKEKSFPGVLLFISNLIVILTLFIRAVSAGMIYIFDLPGDILYTVQLAILTVNSFTTLTWPVAFAFLVMFDLKQKEQREKKEKAELLSKVHLHAERERVMNRELDRTARLASIGTLASGIAHEINNPNNYMRLNAENLRDICIEANDYFEDLKTQPGSLQGIPMSELKESVTGMIDDIIDGSKRIAVLARELKEYSRPDENEEPQQTELQPIIETAYRIVSNSIKKCTNQFSIEIADNLPPIQVRKHKIEQVIINLLNNACEALSDKEQAITVSAIFDNEKEEVEIAVEDEGQGIPETEIIRIRDPFYTSKRAQGGTGMGLSICDRIVQSHEGRMEIESELGLGTTIRVFLPVSNERNKNG